jgi:hypothetical protein
VPYKLVKKLYPAQLKSTGNISGVLSVQNVSTNGRKYGKSYKIFAL